MNQLIGFLLLMANAGAYIFGLINLSTLMITIPIILIYSRV